VTGQWCVLNPKSVNSKATQTNQECKKTKQNAKGNPFFELTNREQRRFNRRQWMARQRRRLTADDNCSWSATELDNGGGRESE